MGISPTTPKNQFIEAMIKQGASLQACTMWFALMTSAATNEDQLEYVWRLTDLGKHIEAHPVNIITTCLSQGKFTKVDDEMMKCVWQLVSDDTDSQQETDEFWKDADGEVEIISKKDGDDESSGSYEEEEEVFCKHGISISERDDFGCHECGEEQNKRLDAFKTKSFAGVKRKLVPRCIDDEACEVENPKA